MTKEDEKSNAQTNVVEEKKNETKISVQDLDSMLFTDLKRSLGQIERAVLTKDSRLISRLLRNLASTRKRLNTESLRNLIQFSFSSEANQEQKENLLKYLQVVSSSSMNVDSKVVSEMNEPIPMDISSTESNKEDSEKRTRFSLVPEVEIYVRLLVSLFLIDSKHYEEAIHCTSALMDRLKLYSSRRTMNPLSAKAFFYYSRAYELSNRLEEIRSNLLAWHRTTSLNHNDEAQGVLLNLLLRNYLAYNLYDQAEKLVSKTQFKEESASSNQYARYLFYQGKIKTIQLEYTDAYRCLLSAIRKAPQIGARGFRLAVHKLACIVQLLIGEIPERTIFRQAGLKRSLVPYLELTKSVRIGDLAAYVNIMKTYSALFHADKTYNLIQRLRPNVIKTGLRKINLSYSRISFEDICSKLHLDSVDDVEFIVAKAIRDGVISAVIDHEHRFIQSKEIVDLYASEEPLSAYHRRITFCLNTHNEAVKAMRFPPNAHKPSLESAKERREREQEIAKNLAEEDEEEF